jgi:glycosyltransferase involved in cell wall biosynthesis
MNAVAPARLVILAEPDTDTPHSHRVFLADVLTELDEARIQYRVVSPAWPIPGSRGSLRHLLVSAFYRHIRYPWAVRRAVEPGSIVFLTSTGLAQLVRRIPADVRIVMFCHDVFALLPPSDLGHRLDFGGRARRWVLGAVQTPMIRRAQLVITPSERTRLDLVRTSGLSGAQIVVIPHRVDRQQFAPGDRLTARAALGLPRDAELVLAVVTSERRKNARLLLDAIAQLAARRPALHLVLLGAVGRRERRRCGHALSGRVTRFEALARADVARCYQAADCLAHVSFYEGFGYPVLEAMASGCPVIAAAGGAVPEVVGRCAQFADPQSSDSIAAAIERVLTDPVLRASLIACGFARADLFTGPRGYASLLMEDRRP